MATTEPATPLHHTTHPSDGHPQFAQLTRPVIWYDEGPVRLGMWICAFWAVVSGVLTAATLSVMVNPQWVEGYPQLAFGRIRPLYWHAAVYGLVSAMLQAGMYLSLQRLCGRTMWRKSLAYLHLVSWHAGVAWGCWMLYQGHGEARIGAELPIGPDCLIAVGSLAFLLNLSMTAMRRRITGMYISMWFYLTSAVAFAAIHLIGNWATFAAPGQTLTAYAGVVDGMVQSWHRQQVVFFLILFPALGLAYHIIPHLTGSPVRRYRAAVLQYWLMLICGAFAGARLLNLTAISDWVSSLAMWGSVLMLFPAWAGSLNLKGMLKTDRSLPGHCMLLLMVVFAGFVWWTLESSVTATRWLTPYTAMTDWAVARDWLVIFVVGGLMGTATIFWLVQHVYRIAAPRGWGMVVSGLLVLGLLLQVVVGAYPAGGLQGLMEMRTDAMGVLVYPDFLDIVRARQVWWKLSAGGAALAAGGWVALAMMLVFLRWRAAPKPAVVVQLSPPVDVRWVEPTPPPSPLADKPVLGLAMTLDQAKHFLFHLRWQRHPALFLTATSLILGVAWGVEFLPVVAQQRAALRIAPPAPYTPLELLGRQIYQQEGCASCHTQMVRPIYAEVTRYGEVSRPEDFVWDRPAQWGLRRVGPDLAKVGGTKNGFWHWQHLENPSQVSPGTVMPSFAHLLDERFDVEDIRRLLLTQVALGITYDEAWLVENELTAEDRAYGEMTELEQAVLRQGEEVAADIVRSGGPANMFDRKATALIAYLQRLGNPPPASATGTP
ncbi:MAG: bifunctional cbb3-type cytochrome C oxidase subunit I/II [Pirellulaceae bacterium]|nr:MAG: bifunctional cbb3-type cytochrome C oxidase subunit I/II [Pirellulaceae bacterium]